MIIERTLGDARLLRDRIDADGADARILWRGGFEQTLIGPERERWDVCFIVEYPSVEAFAAMVGDPVYREAMVHRQAAAKDCRLIRLAAREAGVTFAG